MVCRIVDRLMALPSRWPVVESLAESLRCLPFPQPERVSEPAVAAICRLGEHRARRTRMEAARKLALITAGNRQVTLALKRLLEDNNDDVKAHAAVGLWRAGQSLDAQLLRAIAYGLTSRDAAMALTSEPALVRGLLSLLQDADADLRLLAADVLGGWGYQEEAVPALVGLLEDAHAHVRSRAAWVLGGWGRQEEALAAVVGLLEDADAYVRLSAANVLGGWGHRAEAVPALVGLLRHADAYVRCRAAEVLGVLGHRAEAVPALVGQLEHAGAYVRCRAAEVLGAWGHHEEALPALLGLLESESANVRSSAAEVLGGWGPHAEALPALLGLLESEDASVRYRAASVLGGWGGGGGAAEAVLGALGEEVPEGVVRFLATCGEEPRQAPTREVAAALAEIIRRQPDDSPANEARREVVFRWLWNSVETS